MPPIVLHDLTLRHLRVIAEHLEDAFILGERDAALDQALGALAGHGSAGGVGGLAGGAAQEGLTAEDPIEAAPAEGSSSEGVVVVEAEEGTHVEVSKDGGGAGRG